MQTVSNPKKGTFSGCFGLLFSQVSWKLEYFQIFNFNKRWKHHQCFHFTPIPPSPKIPFPFNTFLIWVSPSMQRKKDKQWSLQIFSWSINTAIWLDKRPCCDKLQIKNAWNVSSFHFIFQSVLFSSDNATPEKRMSTTPYEKIIYIFPPLLALCLHAKNQCDPVISSGDICNHRNLQYNWLKAFPVITQEQEFSQIWVCTVKYITISNCI